MEPFLPIYSYVTSSDPSTSADHSMLRPFHQLPRKENLGMYLQGPGEPFGNVCITHHDLTISKV